MSTIVSMETQMESCAEVLVKPLKKLNIKTSEKEEHSFFRGRNSQISLGGIGLRNLEQHEQNVA